MNKQIVVWSFFCAATGSPSPAAAPFIPSDPDFSMQWALQNSGQEINDKIGVPGADIGATAAWGMHTGGSPTVIAIVGPGVSPHPEFAARLLPGYVTPQAGGDPYSTLDTHGQGTRLAGIIAAGMNNGIGVAGLNPHAAILPVRATNGSSSSPAAVAEGIRWAVEAGAHIILAAVQFHTGSSDLAEAVAYADAAGVLVIAPAGHAYTNEVYYPAAYPECLAVAGTTSLDALAESSNFGPEVDLAAPSEDVWSTLRNGVYGFASAAESGAAAAHVAGAASLIRSYNPQLSSSQIRTILLNSADDLGPPGHDIQFGHGRLNIGAALAMTPAPTLRFEMLDSLPEVLAADQIRTAEIRITGGTHDVLHASPLMIYRTIPGGVQPSIPLRWLGDDAYAVDFPPLPCGTVIEYYLSATANNQFTIFEPRAAPTIVRSARVNDRVSLLADDFEVDRGWTTSADGDGTTGQWVRAEPTGTYRGNEPVQPEYDRSPNEKQICYITGQNTGASLSNGNVNYGPVRLMSPIIELLDRDAEIHFATWVFSDQGNIDSLAVEFSRDGGETWALAEVIDGTNGWETHSFRLLEKSSESGSELVLRFTIADLDQDSLTEAAIDEVRIEAVACTPAGDLDNSGKIDKADWAFLWACLLGPLSPVPQGCGSADLGGDGRIDLRDAAAFFRLNLSP